MTSPIAFQDNLSKAPLAGREQHIQQSSADLAQRQLGLALDREHLLDQSRTHATAASDGAENRVDDREERPAQGGANQQRREEGDDPGEDREPTSEPGSRDHLIDLLA